MRRLIVAGMLYLVGIAAILLIKPTIMFQEDGRWKEFGIGRDTTYFTYIPFWLFTILWSVLSYLTVMLIEDSLYIPSDAIELPRNNARTRNVKQANAVKELVPGYYMLNEGATGRNGVPRYVYLGPEGGVEGELD
jgi:hypothetical protein